MPIGAAIGGVASLGGAAIQASAASKAAKVQQRAAEQARQDYLPFLTAGQSALAPYQRLVGIDPDTGGALDPAAVMQSLTQTPGYQFALQQGLGALNNSQAAKGMLRSGNTLRAITEYGQGLATQTLGNERSALAQLASIGAGAAGGAANAASAAGAAAASGAVGAANAWGGAFGNIGNMAMMGYQQQQQQSFLQNLLRPTAYAGSQPALASYGTMSMVPGLSSTNTMWPGNGAFF